MGRTKIVPGRAYQTGARVIQVWCKCPECQKVIRVRLVADGDYGLMLELLNAKKLADEVSGDLEGF